MESNPDFIAYLIPCLAMKTLLGKITTWFRFSGEPNLQKTYILHTATGKHMEMEQRIVRETVSLIIISTV